MTDATPDHADTSTGGAIVTADVVLTLIFVVTSLAAAVFFDKPWTTVSVVIDLSCLAVGTSAFLWGFWIAVQRSRVDDIGVSTLFFLVDRTAPRSVSFTMNSCLAVQVVWGIATAVIRGSTHGTPGSTLAFGVLVPVLGLGLNGLWGAVNGDFAPRSGGKQGTVSHSAGENGQD